MKLPKYVLLILIAGIIIRILYLSYTPYNERTYDVVDTGGHLDYIVYVANHFSLPPPNLNNGWEYHQAPLYYVIAAAVYKGGTLLGFDSLIALQILSLLFSIVFLVFGVMLLQKVIPKQEFLLPATALLTFWPSGIIHAIRIGNDPFYYMLAVISIYFAIRWYTNMHDKYFFLCSLFTALTLATKLNGLMVFWLLGGFFALLVFKKKPNLKLKHILFFLGIVLFAGYFSLFRNVSTAMHDPHFTVLNGSSASTTNPGLGVGNNLNNYLSFDFPTYFTHPFTNTWTDTDGRQYVWNFFLKTMLFGEFSFSTPQSQVLANILSLLLLPVVLISCLGFIRKLNKPSPMTVLMLAWSVLSLCSLLFYRHSYPFSSNGDFRFIFPSLIPFIYFYIVGLNFFRDYKKELGYVCYAIAYSFCVASCLFFLVPIS